MTTKMGLDVLVFGGSVCLSLMAGAGNVFSGGMLFSEDDNEGGFSTVNVGSTSTYTSREEDFESVEFEGKAENSAGDDIESFSAPLDKGKHFDDAAFLTGRRGRFYMRIEDSSAPSERSLEYGGNLDGLAHTYAPSRGESYAALDYFWTYPISLGSDASERACDFGQKHFLLPLVDEKALAFSSWEPTTFFGVHKLQSNIIWSSSGGWSLRSLDFWSFRLSMAPVIKNWSY